MSVSVFDDPKVWRNRAEEARAIADNMTGAVARSMMEDVAVSYDKLAKHAERRNRTVILSMSTSSRRHLRACHG